MFKSGQNVSRSEQKKNLSDEFPWELCKYGTVYQAHELHSFRALKLWQPFGHFAWHWASHWTNTRAISYCSSLCHYHNFIITPLLRHYYIIIMSLLPIRNDEYSIILCYAKGKLLLLYNYYQLLHHYYKHSYVYQLLHIFVSQTCRCLTQSELVLYFQNQQKILKKWALQRIFPTLKPHTAFKVWAEPAWSPLWGWLGK